MEIAVPRIALDKCEHVCVCEGDITFTHISPLTHKLSTVIFNISIAYNVQMLIATKAIYL